MCRQYPCDPRCPNAEPPKPIYTCIRCDREICEGDAYYDIDDDIYCEECIDACMHFAESD